MILKMYLFAIWIIPTIYVGKLISSELYLYPNPKQTEAILMKKEQGVSYKPAGEIIWSDTRKRQQFANNDEVKTKSNANAVIRLRSGNAIKLGENSHIVINTTSGEDSSEIITLVEGNITAAVMKRKPSTVSPNTKPVVHKKLSIVADQKAFELDGNGTQLNLQKEKGASPVQIKSLKGKLGIKEVVAPPPTAPKTFGAPQASKSPPKVAPKISSVKLTEIDSQTVTPDIIEKTNLELVASRPTISTISEPTGNSKGPEPQINTIIEDIPELSTPEDISGIDLSDTPTPSLSLNIDQPKINTGLTTEIKKLPKKIAVKKEVPKYVILPATEENAGQGIWVLSEGKVSGKVEGKDMTTNDYIKAMESLRGICVFKGDSKSVVWASSKGNYAESLSDTLGKKKTIYLLVEETLIPINRKFINKEKDNLKFILEKTFAIFDENVEILTEKVDDF